MIPFIALGLTLSLIFGIEYKCEGQEMFPTYYGSPFVFKMTSLGSSMEYYYSIFGLLLNMITWSMLLVLIRYGILKLIEVSSYKKTINVSYKVITGLLLVFTMLNIFIAYAGTDLHFDENSNYWYWNLDKEAQNWGMICDGEWNFLLL
jgi:hypothetical protein